MKKNIGRITIPLIFLFLPILCFGQNIFSEMELTYKKKFLPYDIPYTFALKDKQFIMLSELKKNSMKLAKYDQYFFEAWEKEIEFSEEESAPQAFLREDTLFTYSITTISEKKQVRFSVRNFDTNTGNEFQATNYVFGLIEKEGYAPQVSFSEDKTKFLIYNNLVQKEGQNKVEFQVFDIGNETALFHYYLDPEQLSPARACSAHLSNDGDIFLTSIHSGDYKLNVYFLSPKSNEIIAISNNFFFERPVEKIEEINIVRQSASSYFVSFTAKIEDELIGFNVTAFNVVLKSVMFSHNQNLRKDEIRSLYENYYFTTDQQKKKYLEIPETLENYRLTKSFVNTKNDIILSFEDLEIPVDFYKNAPSENMPWKSKSKEDKFYFGGDILMYCFAATGEIKWKKTIQKTQFSQGSSLGLSYVANMIEDHLHLLMYESSKGGNFYIMDFDTSDGSLNKTINLLPEKKFEYTKKYSCWLDANAVILCGISPVNITKRTLMLVEY